MSDQTTTNADSGADKPAWLVVSDMDGSLLDHQSYDFSPAQSALAQLRARRIPLILASSKTRPEMLFWQERLDIEFPFIYENGAAIYWGNTSLQALDPIQPLADSRDRILDRLRELRQSEGYQFKGFADCSIPELIALTGLSADQAAMALQREFSEPILWQDTEARLQAFKEAIHNQGLTALQGGRFLSIASPSDKGKALKIVRNHYASQKQADWQVIALGDSPNDRPMLAVADIPVVIRSAKSSQIELSNPRLMRTKGFGPEGWQEAMDTLLGSKQDGQL